MLLGPKAFRKQTNTKLSELKLNHASEAKMDNSYAVHAETEAKGFPLTPIFQGHSGGY